MLLDILLLIAVVSGFINGFRRGLIYSLFAFIGLFFGLLLALKYSYLLSSYLYHQGFSTKFLPFISFVVLFLSVLIMMKLASKLVQSVADTLFLGTVNKIIGGVLWAALLLMIYSTVLWYLDVMQLISPEIKASSKSYPFMVSLAPVVIEEFSRLIPWFKGIFDAVKNLFQQSPAAPITDGIEV